MSRSREKRPFDPLDQRAAVGAVGPNEPQSGEAMTKVVQHELRPRRVGNIGRRDDYGQHEPQGIHYDMALAPLDLFARIVPLDPPFPVVFTD